RHLGLVVALAAGSDAGNLDLRLDVLPVLDPRGVIGLATKVVPPACDDVGEVLERITVGEPRLVALAVADIHIGARVELGKADADVANPVAGLLTLVGGDGGVDGADGLGGVGHESSIRILDPGSIGWCRFSENSSPGLEISVSGPS